MVTNLKDIETQLFKTADQLRANSGLKPSEYSRPVLGLVFLRYAETQFAAVEATLAPRPESRLKPGPDDYKARGVVYLAPESRFSHLTALPEDADIGRAINNAMRDIERDNPDLADVLPKNFNEIPKNTLIELVRLLAPLVNDDDAFGQIYEYFMGAFAIAQRGLVDQVLCDAVCYSRFCDLFERRAGEWKNVFRQPIYEQDRLDPVDPGAILYLDPELLASFPNGYRHLGYMQTKLGLEVKRNMPGLTGPEVEALYARGTAWLKGDQRERSEYLLRSQPSRPDVGHPALIGRRSKPDVHSSEYIGRAGGRNNAPGMTWIGTLLSFVAELPNVSF